MFFQRLLNTLRGSKEESPAPLTPMFQPATEVDLYLRRDQYHQLQQQRRNLRIRQINLKQELIEPKRTLKVEGYGKTEDGQESAVISSQALPRSDRRVTERRHLPHAKGAFRSSTVSESNGCKAELKLKTKEDKKLERLQKPEPCESVRPLYQLRAETEARIKAYSYAVLDPSSLKVLVSNRAQVSLEVASLTKVMTCFTVLEIARKNALDICKQTHVISTKAENMSGTSAQMLGGQIYTVEQLLYAMMLPSGNDAAIALAEWGGGVLRSTGQGNSKEELKESVRAFVREMNRTAVRLGLKNSKWSNPHGLSDQLNKSTAYDMAKLCCIAMRQPQIRKVTSTRHYRTTISTVEGLEYPVEWENTNKLLGKQGYFGVKTGVTSTAGPCMASAYEHGGHSFVVVILRTSKLSRRFKDSKVILQALLKEMMNKAAEDKESRRELYLHFRRTKQQDESEEDSAEEEFVFDGSGALSLRRRERIVKNMCG